MIYFRDRTFCCSKDHKTDCTRQWTPELSAAAEKWWGGKDAPVAFSAFCDSESLDPDSEDVKC